MCIFLVVVIDGLDADFGVGIRIEGVALADHLLTELLVVLDDSVVNTDYVVVINDMRMSIVLGRLTVSGPSCVADAACAG